MDRPAAMQIAHAGGDFTMRRRPQARGLFFAEHLDGVDEFFRVAVALHIENAREVLGLGGRRGMRRLARLLGG